MKGKEKKEEKQKQAQAQEEQTEQTEPVEQPPQPAEQEAAKETSEADETRQALEALQKDFDKQKDLLLRTAAEYENFRKRTEREKRAIYGDATAAAVLTILPIGDSLEYAIKAKDGATAEYQKGLELMQNQFKEALNKLGVEPMGAPGEEFNPELHNAVAHVDDDTVADNIIVEVFQTGDKMGDKVIRHAMVKVAN